MPYRRRVLLLGGLTVTGGGLFGYHELTECNEIACFSFEYHGADDVPSRLDIEHTGGKEQLQAEEVYFTNVSVDYEAGEIGTLAWAELDDDSDPSDSINGESIRIPLGLTEIVKILWRQETERRIIEAWVYDDDVDQGR